MGPTVYRVDRLRLVLAILLCAGMGGFTFLPAVHDFLRAGHYRGSLAVFKLVPPDVRVMIVVAVGLLFVAMAVSLVRFLFDDRMVTVDAQGIEVRHYFSVHRARWADFEGMKPIGLGKYGTIQLRFRKTTGFRTKVNLPAAMLGVDNKAVILDLAQRVNAGMGRRPATVPPAAATVAAAPRAMAAVVPEGRRVFGRR